MRRLNPFSPPNLSVLVWGWGCRTLKEVLESWNYRVLTATNGKEALAILETMDPLPDLILSDVVMPEMSGIALFKTLHQRQMKIPILFLSGHLRGEELDQLRQYGLQA